MESKYVVSKVEITPANFSIDGKRHKHKYYLYPVNKRLSTLGFGDFTCWSYENGKRGALKFTNKREAQRIAKRHNATVEEV